MKVYASNKPNYVFKNILKMNLEAKKVLIKPNLVTDIHSSKGVTTDLRLITKLIKFLKQKGARVSVGEASLAQTNMVFKKLGVDKLPCKVIDFEKDKRVKVKSKTGLVLKEFSLPKSVVDAHLIISFAKLKTHALTTVTLSVKNLFGFLSNTDRKIAHKNGLNESIVDLLSFFDKKKIVGLVDGVVCLDGKLGPVTGNPRKLGLVIGSRDLVSCDSSCVGLISANFDKITHLKLCNKYGLGEKDFELIGVNLDDYKQNFNLPPSFYFITSKLLDNYRRKMPYLSNPDNCTKCLSCVNNCPVKAVNLNGRITFDYKKCIGCMICLESCKMGALNYKLKFPATIIDPVYRFLKNFLIKRRK